MPEGGTKLMHTADFVYSRPYLGSNQLAADTTVKSVLILISRNRVDPK
jgi:hypothetical protein